MTLINHFCSKVKCNKFLHSKKKTMEKKVYTRCEHKHFCSMNFHHLIKALSFAKLFFFYLFFGVFFYVNKPFYKLLMMIFEILRKTFRVRHNKFYADNNNNNKSIVRATETEPCSTEDVAQKYMNR